MFNFDEDFRFSHATLAADSRLFKALFGIAPKEFCSLAPDNYHYNDLLCWERLEEDGQITGWLATIPTAEEIAKSTAFAFNDGQPKYPWRHIDEAPVEVEPYPLCLKLLRKAGSGVLITPDVLPYCGGLDRYGAFGRPTESIRLVPCGKQGWPMLCQAIAQKKTDTRMAAGFGLDANGTWYPATWFMRSDGVVQSANDYAQYYGVLLSVEAGGRFLRRYAQAEQKQLELPQW
jgi:hypothetical protein